MDISYITHSCFLVGPDGYYLLFDYYRGTPPRMREDKLLYVFASHAHTDHYSTRIFKLKYPSTTWVLSSDITVVHPHIRVEAGKYYTVNDPQVRTLTPTDEGVAFLVTAEDNCIYHAGDLNW